MGVQCIYYLLMYSFLYILFPEGHVYLLHGREVSLLYEYFRYILQHLHNYLMVTPNLDIHAYRLHSHPLHLEPRVRMQTVLST